VPAAELDGRESPPLPELSTDCCCTVTAGRTTQLVSIELFVDDNVVKFGVPPLLPELVIAVDRCAEKRRRNNTACKCTFCEQALQMLAPINMCFPIRL
jgi:hypothetical protein